jgi:quinoprotein glucose dehydrogenase
MGGPIMTAGGLVFVSGATDQKLRALDVETGKELWSVRLPAGGQATPMTYQSRSGNQYVVIASGGYGDLPVTLGDSIIAYALP